jgi:SAM-dependent methyltransferase
MDDMEETRDLWDRLAADWRIQVGASGDSNRILNSDPVLWAFAGNVSGSRVLDAGCGTGYLTRQLAERGALVTGVDFSERMIEIARAEFPGLDFRVDSSSELRTLGDGEFDLITANYLLMDTPDLEGTMRAFARVLRPGGRVVAVFSHPCFPQGDASISDAEGDGVTYRWRFPYFERRKCIDSPWAHFTTEFIWFHRPLSDYWKAFRAAGFEVTDFEEPRLAEERYSLAPDERKLRKSRTRPYSVAFKLRKAAAAAV